MIAIGIALYLYKNFFITKKFNDIIDDVMKRDDRIKEFQIQIDKLKEDNLQNFAAASQLSSAIFNIKQYIESLNQLRTMADKPHEVFQESSALIQGILNILAIDIKSVSGEFENWAILTIDGLTPMSEECHIICETYAAIISGVLNENLNAFITQQQFNQALVDADEEDEEVG